ncbi:phage tail tube protein [Rhizobium multihospitium]|uniref:Phage tail tube protein n=1 Tax=Rhizobium multihospitium TaxID=410764 RepID=A0A1C3WL09_9HYPH|nr:phage tail tube protein [Rhizobium multihospitium]SCB40752.1 Phage tail tube protein [Rhizobium multihospitium]
MKPTTVRFGRFVVQLGKTSGGTTTYTSPCGFTSKSLQFSKDLNDVQIPDCDDPDAVSWLGRDVASLSAQVSGEGVLAQEAVDDWLEAVESIDSIPVQIILQFPAKTITWTGHLHVSEFTVSGEMGGRVTASVTMNSDGELTRVTTPVTP